MHSFLLIGQSNMAGRGFLDEAIDVDTSRIYMLRNGRWQKMFRPINPDRSFSGTSLAESFAEKYAETHDVKVGLICCADGGTTLEQWLPGNLLYDNAVAQAKLAMRTSSLSGILWHQGESDCAGGRHAVYEANLLQMLKYLRRDLGLPDIPILLGGLGDYLDRCPRPAWEFQNYPIINAASQTVAKSLGNASFVSAAGLTPNPDQLHFNAASLYKFGLRYFDEFEKLTPVSAGAVSSDTERSEMELL